MNNSLPARIVTLCAVGLISASAFAQTSDAAANDDEARYTAVIEKRTQDILVLLEFKDAASSNRIHDVIMGQYRALNAWDEKNEAKLKELNKDANSSNAELAAKAKNQIAAIKASKTELHDKFISSLSADLTPADVEKVKDKMTYNKVQVTYDGYCAMLPNLTDEQKAKILAWLKEARETAMDGGSAKEKTDVFNKYKGRINNYLSKEGYDLAAASKEWNERIKAQKKPDTDASEK